jgi:hypothetical protein
MNTIRAAIAAGLMLAWAGSAIAKLPPPTPEEEAKAAEAKEKAKAAAAAAEEATRRAQDRVAERYIAQMKAKGITVHPTPVAGPPTAAVTTSPGNTPAGSKPDESPERDGKSGGLTRQDASGPDTGKDSHKNR